MCRPSECNKCGRASWIGCGQHIPTAMNSTPKDQWCTCKHPEDSNTSKEYPPKSGTGIPN